LKQGYRNGHLKKRWFKARGNESIRAKRTDIQIGDANSSHARGESIVPEMKTPKFDDQRSTNTMKMELPQGEGERRD